MSNRRDFLKTAAGAAGVLFTSCSLLEDRARAQGNAKKAAPQKRVVTVKGKRIRTIDVHAHCMIPEAMALMGRKVDGASNNVISGKPAEDRFATMDEWGIDMQALSINPVWYGVDRDVATKMIQLQNEKLAELCGKYPDRFVAFSTVALQFPDLAAQQLEEGIKKYNLRGAAIGGHVNGDELSNPKYDVFWKKAEELDALLFMHPQGIPDLDKRLQGNGGLTNVIGNPIETTIFLAHLIYDGTLDKFPGLKICSAHAGGYLPSYSGRFDYGCVRFPEACKGNKEKPSSYLKKLFFDCMTFTNEGLRHQVAESGATQIMVGTDYPFAWSTTMIDQIMTTPGLSDADKRLILGENAARLLKIKA